MKTHVKKIVPVFCTALREKKWDKNSCRGVDRYMRLPLSEISVNT